MKHSPLCSRDNGREVFFTAKDGTQKLRFTLSRDLLDDVCGDTAVENARKKWVKENISDILKIRTEGRRTAPYDRVHVEEIA